MKEKQEAIARIRASKGKRILVGIVTGIVNGLFGSGGGTIAVPAMEEVLKVEPHRAHASAIAIIFPLSIISLIVYMNRMPMNYSLAVWVSIGGAFGGFIGAKLLKKVPTLWLRRIFGAFMIVAALRMFFR